MNKPAASIDAATATSSSFQRSARVLFLTLSIFPIATYGNLLTVVQSQTAAPPPAATPATVPGQKPDMPAETAAAAVKGTIKGRVVSDDGRPLTNASVMAQATNNAGKLPKATRVDSDGRFSFDEMPAALYVVFATAPGYIDPSISTAGPSQWPRHLIGAQLRITLVKGGVITGSVTNSSGEAVVGVPVRANPADGPSLAFTSLGGAGGMSESDDRGIYRIYGLPPGQYTVSTGGSGQLGLMSATGFDLDIPTYYPSSTRDTAVPISVRSGDATTGIDIKYRSIEGHSVSGVVLGTIDAPASSGAVTVMLTHAGTTSVFSFTIASVAEERRAFSFNGIADGEYDVLAGFLSDPNQSAFVGTRRVTVRGADVTGIELRPAPLSSLAGTVRLDAIKPEERCDKRGSQLIETSVEVPRDDQKRSGSQAFTALLANLGGALNDKGEFAVRNLEAGRYRLEIKLPTESWYVRAINLAGAPPQPGPQSSPAGPPPAKTSSTSRNTWQGVVTLKIGERIGGVSIAIGQDAATLRGRVATAVVPAGLRVHLIPVDPEQANNLLRYSETTVNSDGTFQFTNMAPGHYLIFTRVEPPSESDAPARPAAWDPAARAKLRREADAAKIEVELKPCQAVVEYQLKLSAAQ